MTASQLHHLESPTDQPWSYRRDQLPQDIAPFSVLGLLLFGLIGLAAHQRWSLWTAGAFAAVLLYRIVIKEDF